jgi:hypothetical protein
MKDRKEEEMSTTWEILTTVFVLAALAFIAVGVFWLTPFARDENEFRDSRGKRRGGSPHMETRDDYESAHPA